MKSTLLVLIIATCLPLRTLHAENPPSDPLAGAFFPPDLIMLAREQVGISKDQLEAIRANVEKTQQRSENIKQHLAREGESFAAMAKQEHVDENALIAQLDKMLDAERAMKHLHIGLLAAIKNTLTSEQQTKLRDMMKDGGGKLADETRKRLTGKVAQIQATAQKWAEENRDPSHIGQTMQDSVKPLLDAGKVSEAEVIIDRLLQELKAGDK